MPSADFCSAIAYLAMYSVPSGTHYRSPWVRMTTFPAQLPNLHKLPLDGYGLCDIELTRPSNPASYLVSVRQLAVLLHASFRPHLTMTPLRYANPSPPSGWVENFHLLVIIHARHTRVARRNLTLRLSQNRT